MSDECKGCALHDSTRREFLKDGLLAALALFGSVRLLDAASVLGSSVTYPIPAADGASIDKKHEVILVRWQNAIYALALACPHQHTALRWHEDDARFQCPKHKSKYQPDGTFISGRATRGMDRYSLRREGDSIVVDVAVVHRQDKDLAGWNAAVVRL